MPATTVTVDFRNIPEITQHSSGNVRDRLPTPEPPRTADGKLLTPKQIRARARRKMQRKEVMTDQEMEHLYQKPIEDWDLEELARGRPRNAKGTFSGPRPKWINAQVHEAAMERYKAAVKTDMRATTVDALEALKWILQNDDVDDKGKPIVPVGAKLDASKFLLEHVVGKPTQEIKADVSVKLQAILGQVLVNPSDAITGSASSGYELGHMPGYTMPLAVASDEDDIIDAEIM